MQTSSASSSPSSPPPPSPPHDITIPETLITLIVCFVIAMAFRGFVLEGFVIPTGSMAPTLMGDHALWRSPETGYVFATDAGEKFLRNTPRHHTFDIADPMLDRNATVLTSDFPVLRRSARAGDRVLVLKWFYAFVDPERFDVIVFKNPTNSWENYIKRVVGLPGEELWLADGDVFVRPADESDAPFTIARKPRHVQRAVWQPIFDSAYVRDEGTQQSEDPWTRLTRSTDDPRMFRIDSADETIAWWDTSIRALDDWNAYNMLGPWDGMNRTFPVSDLRLAMAVRPDQSGLLTALGLVARGHSFEFFIANERATIEITETANPDVAVLTTSAPIDPIPAGRTTLIEFWHADQSLSIFIDGECVLTADYDWGPWERLEHATGQDIREVLETSRAVNPLATVALPGEPSLELSFTGSPLTITRLQVDRDLYYQPLDVRDPSHGPLLGTHPDRTARLDEDQFFMLGDNSAASADSRLWGEPDELVAAQIDPTPFIVNRKLIIGKAWCVYFPSPYALFEGGRRFIPDFGRMRFIR